jgi:hypothetical protein
MIDSVVSAAGQRVLAPSRNRALLKAAGSVVLVVLAGYVVVYLLRLKVVPVDFHVYRQAAEEIADGDSPYPWFAYPPLSALAAVPFTFLSTLAADFAVKALLIVGVLATLAVLQVRDWRCYAMALLWPQMNAAVQTGNITIPLALGAAVLWRYRSRPTIAGAGLGIGVAAKFLLWPLWLWLVAVRRYAAAAWSIAIGAGVTLVTWAVVDFRALVEYPSRLRQLNEDTTGKGYTLDTLASDLGADGVTARAFMSVVAVALLVAVVVVGRRGNEMRSFVLAVAAALAASPILWLHYFALLLVPVAIVSPRLGPLWFVPMAIWGVGAGTGNGTTFEAAVVTLVVAVTFLLAARAAPPDRAHRTTPETRGAVTPRAAAGRP